MNNTDSLKNAIAKPRRIALYASMTMADYYCVMQVPYYNYDERYNSLPEGQEREGSFENYVRVTDPVEIGFRAIDNDEIVQKAVESLDEAERKAIAELNEKIAAIRKQKAALLTLTHQPETA